MKYLVNGFFVGIMCLCCEVSSIERLYSGNVRSEHARTYIYPCKGDNGLHFVGAITVDLGNNNYPSGQEMLEQLKGLLEPQKGIYQLFIGKVRGFFNWVTGRRDPRVIWSGSFHFIRESACSFRPTDSFVKFHSVYNEDTYLDPVNDQQNVVSRVSRRYYHEEIDRFERNIIDGGTPYWTLEDDERNYLHCSDGTRAVSYGNRYGGWRGEGSVTRIGDCVNADLGSMRVRALSMGEFLTGIGQSQGYDRRGRRFAPRFEEDNQDEIFVNSVLEEFRQPGYSRDQ